MNDEMTRYSSNDILQILTDFYNCQSEFDPETEKGEELTFDTTIADWRIICDLVGPRKLAKYHHDLFKLQSPIADMENILIHEKQNKLRDFCNYIAQNGTRQDITPIISLGQSCMTASIFKTLLSNLKNRGINTDNIRPSSEFVPLFNKFGSELLEEVNKLAPGSLTKFEYRDNRFVRTGWSIIAIFILLIIVIPLIWQFHWGLMTILGFGLILVIIGKRFNPEKEIIGGYDTVRDLIFGMQSQISKTTT
jgi:hypothetical protein